MIPETFHIQNYDDFVAVLLKAGFAMGGGNSEGIFSGSLGLERGSPL